MMLNSSSKQGKMLQLFLIFLKIGTTSHFGIFCSKTEILAKKWFLGFFVQIFVYI